MFEERSFRTEESEEDLKELEGALARLAQCDRRLKKMFEETTPPD